MEYNFKNYLNNTRITLISILWSVLATATDLFSWRFYLDRLIREAAFGFVFSEVCTDHIWDIDSDMWNPNMLFRYDILKTLASFTYKDQT